MFFEHLDEKKKAWLAFIGAAILFLVEAGLQLSGMTSLPLAIVLWGLAAVLVVYWLSHFERAKPLYVWIHSHWTAIAVCGFIAALSLFFWGGMQFQYWQSGGAVYQKLGVDNFGPLSIAFNQETKKLSVTYGATLKDWSPTDIIFCQSIGGGTEIQGRVNPEENPVSAILMLQPQQTRPFAFATIEGIDLSDPKTRVSGRIRLEMRYGPATDQMNYVLTYQGEIQLTPRTDAEGQIIGALSAVTLKSYEHAKIKK